MTALPRLTITREQLPKRGGWVHDDDREYHAYPESVTLRLPERPMMPCPECEGTAGHNADDGWTDCRRCRGTGDPIPILDGTRVEVGFIKDWNISEPRWQRRWHPVATATVTEVTKHITVNMDDDVLGEWTWLVTLTDIEAVEGR